MPKIVIVYDPNDGTILADGRVVGFINQVIAVIPKLDAERPYRVQVANETAINEFRIAVKQGRIACDDIAFEYLGQFVPHSAQGRFAHWPEGFCPLMDRQLTDLTE